MRRLLTVLLFFLLSSPIFVRPLNPSLNDDVLGLIVFKADIQDPDGKLTSWNEDDDSPCNWFGIKCNPRSNRVSDVVLEGLNLSGKIGRGLLQLKLLRKLSLVKNNLTGSLTLTFSQLTNLRILDLSENSFSGSFNSDFFGQCGSLRSISLAKNRFSGQIPASLSSCSSLAAVNFSSNQFSGLIPSEIWSMHGLRSLDLSDNQLEGEIPKEIEGLNNLRAINLQKNQFKGQIPDGIGSCLLLRLIDLSENSLSGTLPNTIKNLNLLNILILRQNSFMGPFPEWIGEMRSLEFLDISQNTLSGELPNSIGNLQSLKTLNVSMNGLTGSLPESMMNCENILGFDASRNSLTGDLPLWLFKLGLEQISVSKNRLTGGINDAITSSSENSHRNLHVLDLSDNGLVGEIPLSFGDFVSLNVLNLARNLLVGDIPERIGELKGLVVLDLGDNRLNGSIPLGIGGAKSLKEFRLENNSLEGAIPSSIGNLSSLVSLHLSRNNLIGPIPASMAKLTDLQNADLSYNKLTGTLPKQLANLGRLLSFNISHNHLQGELPAGGFFNTISPAAVSGNPSLCGAAVNKTCPTVLPKPIVLNPNSSDSTPGSIPQTVPRKRIILSISALIAIGAAAVIVAGVIAITVLNLHVRSTTAARSAGLSGGGDDFSRSPTTTGGGDAGGDSGKLVMFSGDSDFSTGAHALLNKDCELGRGGFGAVYRAVLRDGNPVAIKKLTVSSLVKSQDDFEREVKILGKIRHENLVSLQGYYWTSSLQLLIYEYISGGNLYKHLHEKSSENKNKNFLSWSDRLNVILGMAKGLSHLHKMNIIHYNLKSSNILIDGSGEPKIADFGLARLLPMLDRYVLSSKIQSALGYMAPEFACRTVKITEKCDVYGFGVLVLEVVTGKRPVEYMEDDVVVLCDMVRGALEEGKVEEVVDERLQGKFPAEEAIPVIKLGLICTSQVPSNRPEMAEVINILELIRCPADV